MIKEDDAEIDITREEFEELIKKLERKNKRTYDFLIKSGTGFKTCVLKLCQRLIKAEKFPNRFFETALQQLLKKKFPRENLANHRFTHMKDWLPRCCEALLVTSQIF